MRPEEDFYRGECYPDGLSRVCKPCLRARGREHYANNPGRWRAQHLRRYGITPEDYDRMLDRQSGACAICHKPPLGRHSRDDVLGVDHNHETGAVRGLLCHDCNRGIGALRDDPELVRSALAYLDRHQLQETMTHAAD